MSEPSRKKIFLVCLIMAGIPALVSVIFAWLYCYLPSPEDKFIFGMLSMMIGNIPWGFLTFGLINHFLAKYAGSFSSGADVSINRALILTAIYLTNWGLNFILVFLALTISSKKKTK